MFEKLKKIIESCKNKETEELAKYLEENNVVVLPCAIGTKIYIVGEKFRHGSVDHWINSGHFCWSDMDKVGKSVFLTKKEAEDEFKRRIREVAQSQTCSK